MVLCALCGCKSSTNTSKDNDQQPVAVRFVADSAYQFCAAQCDFGPRTMNSDAHDRCGQWIAGKFSQYGYSVELQQAVLRGYDGTALRATNICATDTVRPSADRILICAHWDSRPWADNDPDSTNWRKPVMAANDGASGVAVMLELARLLQQSDSLRVPVDFVCFDAEDWGVPQWSTAADDGGSWALGAQHWARQYAQQQGPKPRYRFAVLLDMVGGQGAHFFQESLSLQYARSVVNKVWHAARVAGYSSLFPTEEGGGVTDDHVPVNDVARIPCIDIIPHYVGNVSSSFGPTWHTVHDDMDHIDPATLQAVGQTMLQVIFSEE